MKIQIPEKMIGILQPARYKVFYGGRGSGKSWTVAQYLIARAVQRPTRILCTREYQASIKDSVLKLLEDQINRMGLARLFDVQKTTIICVNGSQFIFEGLRHNTTKIKSMEGIHICWVEEAEKVSAESWDILIPTIRWEDQSTGAYSEIDVTFNPDSIDDPTYQRFIVHPQDDCMVQEVNYSDNPWFPEVLRREMEWMRKTDQPRFDHIWLGKPRTQTAAQVFRGKYTVEPFDAPAGARFYFGADWGFSQDPTTLVRCYIADSKLFIDYEVYGVGVDVVDTPGLFLSVPGADSWPITADSARPETISHMVKHGFKMKGATKGKGSVEDGIAFLRSFEQIVIHPRCKHTADELRLYSYKVDKVTGDILPVLEDSHNHCIDALRYAVEALMKNKGKMRPSQAHAAALGV
jgi:phage terminase large subunit